MITGAVASNFDPVVPLIILDADGHEQTIQAVVDTGFNGWLALSKELISQLGLSWRREAQAILADGDSTVFNVFGAEIVWDGQPQTVFVDEMASDPLIGMRLLKGFRLVVEAVDGGPVRIERL